MQFGALPCLMLLFFIPRWFLQFQHVDPAEAVCIHEDLQSRHSLGIHWGTFPTGKEVCYSCTNGHVTCIINSPGNFFVGVCCLVLQTLFLFQTKKCKLPHPFSDLEVVTKHYSHVHKDKSCHFLPRLACQQKDFLKIHFKFAYYSFSFIHFGVHSYTTVVPLKTLPDSTPKWTKSIHVFRPK